jgi:hypothetical protein
MLFLETSDVNAMRFGSLGWSVRFKQNIAQPGCVAALQVDYGVDFASLDKTETRLPATIARFEEEVR